MIYKQRWTLAGAITKAISFEEAIAFLTKFQPEGDRKFEYYNVLGRCYLGVRDYAHARQCFLVWKNLIEQLPEEDTSAETEKNASGIRM